MGVWGSGYGGQDMGVRPQRIWGSDPKRGTFLILFLTSLLYFYLYLYIILVERRILYMTTIDEKAILEIEKLK